MKVVRLVALSAALIGAAGWWSAAPRSASVAQVAFARNCAILVVDMDGSGLRRLTRPHGGCDGTPSWSPDGGRLAFVRRYSDPTGQDREFPGEVYVMRSDGTRVVRIAKGLLDVGSPRWSPNGRLVVVDERRYGAVLAKADGSGQRALARNLIYSAAPAWSPDGTRIAVARSRIYPRKGGIYTVATGGGPLVPVTRVRAGELTGPAWSEDGKRLAYTRLVCETGGFCGAEIRVVDVRDRRDTRLVRVGGAANPRSSWSPDGRTILVSGGRPGIWIVRADGRGERALSAFGEEAAWSPDGRSVIFERPDYDYGGSRTAIYVMDADGRRRHRLVLGTSPSWRPGG